MAFSQPEKTTYDYEQSLKIIKVAKQKTTNKVATSRTKMASPIGSSMQSSNMDVKQLMMTSSSVSTYTHWVKARHRTEFGSNRDISSASLSSLPPSTLHESDVNSNNCSGKGIFTKHFFNKWMRGNQENLEGYLSNYCPLTCLPLIQFFVTFLRSIGQPLMINNTLSGLIISIALGMASPWKLLGGLAGFSISYFMAFALSSMEGTNANVKNHHLNSGAITMPSLVFGLFKVDFSFGDDSTTWTDIWSLLGGLTVYSFLCCILQIAFLTHLSRNQLHPLHLALLCFTWLELTATGSTKFSINSVENNTKSTGYSYEVSSSSSTEIVEELFGKNESWFKLLLDSQRTSDHLDLRWIALVKAQEFFFGIIRSFSLVYCEDNSIIGAVILISFIIFSPFTFIDAVIGAALGQIIGLILKIEASLNGSLAINGALTYVALNFFVVMSFFTKIMGIIGVTFTVVLIKAERRLAENHWPFLTPAFMISTWVMILSISARSRMKKIDICQLRYPEMHRRLFRGGNCVDDEANAFSI